MAVLDTPRDRTGTGIGVELAGLRRTYGSLNALDGLSLQIAPGELVVLLGPSGCGKTTALRILAGLDRADEGQVLVGGEDITRVPANKRDMGMVFQAYSLFPHMTVRDNVAFGLRLRGQDRGRRLQRAREMLELVGLTAFENRYAHQLSGGQQQRVALARALAVEPSVLLLDEPLSALDAKVRVQLREEIRRVQLDVGTTSTASASTSTRTASSAANRAASALVNCEITICPSSRRHCTRENGPRNATDTTRAFGWTPSPAGESSTDSGRTRAWPAPWSIDPSSRPTCDPSTDARPAATSVRSRLLRPTNSATNRVAGRA